MTTPDNHPVAMTPEILIGPGEGAVQRTYAGILTDEDSRRLRRKVFNITDAEEMAVDTIVQSPHSSYRSFSEFVRHAVYEMVMAWVSAGFPDNMHAAEAVTTLVKARLHAQRLAIRGDFQDSFNTIEQSLMDWAAVGDWTAIVKELAYLDGLIQDTQGLSEKWAWRIESMVVHSQAVRQAVSRLYDAWSVGNDDQRKEADKWTQWIELLTQG